MMKMIWRIAADIRGSNENEFPDDTMWQKSAITVDDNQHLDFKKMKVLIDEELDVTVDGDHRSDFKKTEVTQRERRQPFTDRFQLNSTRSLKSEYWKSVY